MSLIAAAPRGRTGPAALIRSQVDLHRPAANRAVLDVVLLLAAIGIDPDRNHLAAVGASDLGLHARCLTRLRVGTFVTSNRVGIDPIEIASCNAD